MTFYRKYRPQTLEELIGQEQITQTLTRAWRENKLSHAYLFCGPRGTGKTSTARILAKMVNCEKGQSLMVNGTKDQTIDQIPCNKCSTCLSITDGSNLDLIEIDAASNRGIDDIRELRERIKLSPTGAKKKVYIIDEVHMLTTEAFNALLKTLEEPPEHVLFILATTDPHKIPATILSRVTRLNFKQANSSDLVQALKVVAKQEKLKVPEEALVLIAKKADGSYRDAEKLLDQLASSGQEITLQFVEDNLKSGNLESLIALHLALSSKNSKEALNIVLAQVEHGVNAKEYLLSIMENHRNLLLIKHQAGEMVAKEVGEVQFSALSELSSKFTSEQLINNLDYLQNALEKMKTASIPSLPLEIAVIESCSESVVVAENVKVKEEVILRIEPEVSEVLVANIQPKATDTIIQSGAELLILHDKWNYILETVKPFNYSLEALLRAAKLLEFTDEKVLIEVPYSFHQRIIDTPRNREVLESILSDILAKPVSVGTVLGKRPVRIEELANVELAADDEIIKIAAEIFNS